jgi:hypothetical protein
LEGVTLRPNFAFMIQRIQSVYLLLVVIIHCLLFTLPIYKATSSLNGTVNTIQADLNRVQFDDNIMGAQKVVLNQYSTAAFTLNIVLIALTIVCIFMYKKRGNQLRMSRFLVLFSLVLVLLFIIIVYKSKNYITGSNIASSFQIGFWISLLSPVFLLLAGSRIRYDERLVRSADRLR